MEEKKKIVPDFGYVAFVDGRPEGLPKPKVVRCGTKNRNYAPIKVKRTIRTGVRVYQPGESVDWTKAYEPSGMSGLTMNTPFTSRWS